MCEALRLLMLLPFLLAVAAVYFVAVFESAVVVNDVGLVKGGSMVTVPFIAGCFCYCKAVAIVALGFPVFQSKFFCFIFYFYFCAVLASLLSWQVVLLLLMYSCI
jgi:hypothetical protein